MAFYFQLTVIHPRVSSATKPPTNEKSKAVEHVQAQSVVQAHAKVDRHSVEMRPSIDEYIQDRTQAVVAGSSKCRRMSTAVNAEQINFNFNFLLTRPRCDHNHRRLRRIPSVHDRPRRHPHPRSSSSEHCPGNIRHGNGLGRFGADNYCQSDGGGFFSAN